MGTNSEYRAYDKADRWVMTLFGLAFICWGFALYLGQPLEHIFKPEEAPQKAFQLPSKNEMPVEMDIDSFGTYDQKLGFFVPLRPGTFKLRDNDHKGAVVATVVVTQKSDVIVELPNDTRIGLKRGQNE